MQQNILLTESGHRNIRAVQILAVQSLFCFELLAFHLQTDLKYQRRRIDQRSTRYIYYYFWGEMQVPCYTLIMKSNYAFIDSQNLYLSVAVQG